MPGDVKSATMIKLPLPFRAVAAVCALLMFAEPVALAAGPKNPWRGYGSLRRVTKNYVSQVGNRYAVADVEQAIREVLVLRTEAQYEAYARETVVRLQNLTQGFVNEARGLVDPYRGTRDNEKFELLTSRFQETIRLDVLRLGLALRQFGGNGSLKTQRLTAELAHGLARASYELSTKTIYTGVAYSALAALYSVVAIPYGLSAVAGMALFTNGAASTAHDMSVTAWATFGPAAAAVVLVPFLYVVSSKNLVPFAQLKKVSIFPTGFEKGAKLNELEAQVLRLRSQAGQSANTLLGQQQWSILRNQLVAAGFEAAPQPVEEGLAWMQANGEELLTRLLNTEISQSLVQEERAAQCEAGVDSQQE